MPEPKNGPAPGSRGGARINAAKRPSHCSTARVDFEPAPGRVQTAWLTRPEAEMLTALRHGPVTRAELLMLRPRLALSAPQIVERLRRKGVPIETLWRRATDRDGRDARFGEYRLTGKVLARREPAGGGQ
jgi:hypothetical protein